MFFFSVNFSNSALLTEFLRSWNVLLTLVDLTHALIALSFRHFPLFKIFSAQCTYSRCCLVRPRALLIALSKNRFISYGPKLLRAEDENFLKFLFGIPRLAPNRFCVFLPRVKAGISITSCHRRDLPQKITQQDRSVQKGKRRDLKENRSILLRSFVRFFNCTETNQNIFVQLATKLSGWPPLSRSSWLFPAFFLSRTTDAQEQGWVWF